MPFQRFSELRVNHKELEPLTARKTQLQSYSVVTISIDSQGPVGEVKDVRELQES